MSKFLDLCRVYAASSALQQELYPRPIAWFGSLSETWDADTVVAKVRHAMPAVPRVYRETFAEKLGTAVSVGALIAGLQRELDDRVRLGDDEGYEGQLRLHIGNSVIDSVVTWRPTDNAPQQNVPDNVLRLMTVSHDLYRRFEEAARKLNLQVRPDALPPLINFAQDPVWGPLLINADRIEKWIGSRCSVTSLPKAYESEYLHWIPLAHETFGHAVMHSIKGRDWQNFLEIELRKSKIVPEVREELWCGWLEELACDIYATICLGSAFPLGFLAWSSARLARDPTAPYHQLGSISNVFYTNDGRTYEHPPDLLRLHAMIAAVEELEHIDSGLPQHSAEILHPILRYASKDTNTLNVYDVVQNSVVLTYHSAAFIRDARAVGAFLTGLKLPFLEQKSMLQTMPWTLADENKANTFREMAINGWPAEGMAVGTMSLDAEHCLSGAIMAVYDNAAREPCVSTRLAEALLFLYTDTDL